MSPELKPGIEFEWTYVVPERSTVPRLYHDTPFCLDMPDVLATGYMVGMMELACVNGIMPYVDWPREQSVGVHVNFSHLAATPPGMTLQIRGKVVAVEGRRVKFRVEAWDGMDKITEGEHERMIIAPEKFNAKLAEKKAKACAEA
ncbi:MAG TPA: thioesterase family protein [Noviherbaspirillum sp.]|uniref:thioesterase family protein n=1 Tax=Noviherbaspirillum sp. TaxID=1926288 RepID=UPI002B46A229|nr:thioesterase family protein [Noviherbaspirillum sp.]HJV83841.1 thioesterase family protein [Noviherbaspirillum sp.]